MSDTNSPYVSWAGAEHGGTDDLGTPEHDFSTNSNACGPCPPTLHAIQSANSSHYPDPQYRDLHRSLAQLHQIEEWRIVLAGSASEFIHRFTAWAQLQGIQQVELPVHSYADYAHAASVRRMKVVRRQTALASLPWMPPQPEASIQPILQWACEPASPCGTADPALASWITKNETQQALLRMCDCAYLPLTLTTKHSWLQRSQALQSHCWQMFSPNKSLGMTGIRAAYAIAPMPDSETEIRVKQQVHELNALAASWPIGSHGVAMLQSWAENESQQWLAQSKKTLADWKSQQTQLCESLQWQVLPGSMANYMIAAIPDMPELRPILTQLRQTGIKLRDCNSFGLAGHVRLGVRSPQAQEALWQHWQALSKNLPVADHQLRSAV